MKDYKIFLSIVDHTLLSATATLEEIEKLAKEALQYEMASICIPPSYVKQIKEKFPELTVCTVIGFPLGYMTTEAKLFEARNALQNGADELDMVINIGRLKSSDFDYISDEIKNIRNLGSKFCLKVIIEACYLNDSEIIRLCEIITDNKVDYIKTSTGFGKFGADPKQIELFKKHIGPDVKIKAAGGIKTIEDVKKYIDLGVSRLGMSGALQLINGNSKNKNLY